MESPVPRPGQAGGTSQQDAIDLATRLQAEATDLIDSGRLVEAVSRLRATVDICRGLPDDPPGCRPYLAAALTKLASALADQCSFEEAVDLSVEAAGVAAQDERPSGRRAWVVALTNLGPYLAALNDYPNALEVARKAVHLARLHEASVGTIILGQALNNLSLILLTMNHPEEASKVINEAVDAFLDARPTGDPVATVEVSVAVRNRDHIRSRGLD